MDGYWILALFAGSGVIGGLLGLALGTRWSPARPPAFIPPDELRATLARMDAGVHEIRRRVVRANRQAEAAKAIAERAAQTLTEINLKLGLLDGQVDEWRADRAGQLGAERAYQQRRAGDPASTQFIGTNTLQGPTAGGNIGTIGPLPPPRPTERHFDL